MSAEWHCFKHNISTLTFCPICEHDNHCACKPVVYDLERRLRIATEALEKIRSYGTTIELASKGIEYTWEAEIAEAALKEIQK